MENGRAIQQFGVMLQQQAILNVRHAIQLVQQPIAVHRRRRRRQRRWWTRPWLTQERRLQFGQYSTILAELREGDTSSFKNYMRMTPEMFDELLQRLTPRLQKSDTHWRKALDPGLKLAVTLRHLAAGDSYPSLSYDFRVARTTISLFIPEVCEAIVQSYSEEVIPIPNTPEEWRPIAEEFERRWNVPHACGALDGKHIALRKPRRSGSEYYNYKGFFSIVLMALVDANYRFLWIDVGGHGHMSDAQIYNNSELNEMLEDGTIGLPPPEPLPNDDRDMPYFILGDDAFGLRTYLMKPFGRRGLEREKLITNYRLSRGRRVVENAFGILAARFRVLLTTMQQTPEIVATIVESCVCLHNLMRIRYPGLQQAQLDQEDDQHNLVPGAWRTDEMLTAIQQVRGHNRDATDAKQQREYLSKYFNSAAGSVPWQDRMVN
ncbi:putative nuclease HARBI1 [Mercenaria mercenaria]|uniref:putative nuclease HARBI1 n=1 Tax=Mercenaria mercenaria TaxID=6596 RepID=UPI00234ECFBB|nr:putative nuclease HARBI1 [Mercenaria mercenaria]